MREGSGFGVQGSGISQRMSKSNVFIGLLVVFFTLNCEAGSVEYDYNREADFSAYHTYAWQPKMVDVFAGRVRANIRQPINIKRIKDAIESELAKKGIEKVNRNNADIHIAFHAQLEEKVNLVDWGYGASYEKAYHGHVYYDNTLDVDHFTEGTLFIDIIDAKRNELVWRGWTKRRVPDKVKEKLVNKVVSQVMKKYPPGRK